MIDVYSAPFIHYMAARALSRIVGSFRAVTRNAVIIVGMVEVIIFPGGCIMTVAAFPVVVILGSKICMAF